MACRTSVRHLARVFALALSLALVAPVAGAKEESKIQIHLQPTGGAGNVRGDVRTKLQGAKTILALRVRFAEPETEHVLVALPDEISAEGLELARFTTGAKGQFTGSFDLAKGDDPEAPVDPRGKYLVLRDGTGDVLAGWLYGAPEDDPPKTKVKELTSLAPDETTAPTGEVRARYDMRPNGHGKLVVSLRGVPEGDYELWVDGVVVDSLTPNSAGNAKATFTTKPVHGAGKPHNRKGPLDFDPRRKLIELKQGDALFFSGPMLAQVEGVNVCAASESTTPFALGPGQLVGSGSVMVALGADCETSVAVEVHDLPVASYDLYVDGVLAGAIDVMDEGGGSLVGRVVFDPTPDEPDELPLDFPTASGTTFEVFAAGDTPDTGMPLLTATLP